MWLGVTRSGEVEAGGWWARDSKLCGAWAPKGLIVGGWCVAMSFSLLSSTVNLGVWTGAIHACVRVKAGLARTIALKVVIVALVWSCGVVCCWSHVDKPKLWVDCWPANWWINRLAKSKLFIIIKPALTVRVAGSPCANGVNIFKQMGGLVNVARDVDAGEHEHCVSPPLYGS